MLVVVRYLSCDETMGIGRNRVNRSGMGGDVGADDYRDAAEWRIQACQVGGW